MNLEQLKQQEKELQELLSENRNKQRELIPTPIETKEYEFVLINGLKEENSKMKEAINDVLDVLILGNGVPNLVWVKNRLLEVIK
jgi:Uma2 family endonuclease